MTPQTIPRLFLCILGASLLVFAPAVAGGETGLLRVRATLVELPRAPACDGDLTRVSTLYRVKEVLQGAYPHSRMVVVHRCPEQPRGSRRFGKGTARSMRVGRDHLLTLRPLPAGAGDKDRFSALALPRFEAEVTDDGPESPRIVVLVSGGGGTRHKLTFDAEQVSVGRAPDGDVSLSDLAVAPRQLRIRLLGDQLAVENLAPARGTLVNGLPISGPQKITYKDRIRVGSYTLRAALFLDVPEQS